MAAEYRSLAQLVKVADLVPYGANSRTHSDEQNEQLKAIFRRVGFTGVLAYDERGLAIGHARQRALLEMWAAGETVMGPGKREPLPEGYAPALNIEGLTDAERRALIIADNKIPANAGWDADLLEGEIRELEASDFDVTLLGFSESEMAGILVDKDFQPGSEGAQTRLDEKKPIECPACGHEFRA